MPERSLLFKRSVNLVDDIELTVPTIAEINDLGEAEYFHAVSVFTAQPFQYMVQLDDIGIDYEDIDDFQLFVLLKQALTPEIIDFLFKGTLPLDKMVPAMDNQLGQLVLVNPDNYEQVFSALTLRIIADTMHTLHFTKRETHKPGNKFAKKYLIKKKRRELERQKDKEQKLVLEPLVVSLVNAPEFPYNYSTCGDLTVYQFFCSVQQIPKRIHYDNLMHGVYVGMIDTKEIKWNEVNWLG